MATHSSILAWEISCTEELGGLESMVTRIRQNLATKPSNHPTCPNSASPYYIKSGLILLEI